MSKNVLGSKYDKKIRFGSASAAKSWLYMCNFKLKKGIIFRQRVNTFTILDITTFEIHKVNSRRQ